MRRDSDARRWDKKPWINALCYLGGLAALFFFGFFVIGRIWGSAKPATDKTAPPPTESVSRNATPPTSPAPPANSAGQANSPMNLKAGPTFEAVEPNPTQKPLQEPDSQAKEGDGEDSQDPRTTERNDERTQEPATPDGDDKSKRKSKRKTAPANDENGDANSENRRGKRKKAEDAVDPNAETRNSDPENAPPANRVYRVQAGIYSTREAAEAAKQELDAKGVTAHIRPVTQKGKSYFSVTGGTYKVKANAEAQRDKMKEAGLDAYVKED